MTNFDFTSWYVLLAIFIAHYYRLNNALENLLKEKDELIKLAEDIKSGQANKDGISKKVSEAKKSIFNIDTVILHFLAIAILAAFILVLLNIPNKILDSSDFGPLAESITLGERIVYLIISSLFFISYFSKALLPSSKIMMLIKIIRSKYEK